jgi:carbonic anhydrase
MAEPITASPAEIAALRKAMNGANARPVQALHHRPIFYSSLGGFL